MKNTRNNNNNNDKNDKDIITKLDESISNIDDTEEKLLTRTESELALRKEADDTYGQDGNSSSSFVQLEELQESRYNNHNKNEDIT